MRRYGASPIPSLRPPGITSCTHHPDRPRCIVPHPPTREMLGIPVHGHSKPAGRRLAVAAILVAAMGVVGCGDRVASPSPAVPPPSSGTAPGPTAGEPTASLPGASGTPAPSASAGSGAPPPVLLAAGDIGRCDSTHDYATGALAARLPGVIATLGDTA